MLDIGQHKHTMIYGGSFDPPHNAHVRLPAIAADKINADVLVYMPTGIQPMKIHRRQTAPQHRLAMLRLALADRANTLIDTDEMDRSIGEHPTTPSYTADTLELLRQRLGPHVRLSLLIGADSLEGFWKWHRPRRILELAEPVVMLRPPSNRKHLLSCFPPDQDRDRWASRFVDVPQMQVSSSDIRHRVANGLSIEHDVDPAVERYIRKHGLYLQEDSGRDT